MERLLNCAPWVIFCNYMNYCKLLYTYLQGFYNSCLVFLLFMKVSQRFNEVCRYILKTGLNRAEKQARMKMSKRRTVGLFNLGSARRAYTVVRDLKRAIRRKKCGFRGFVYGKVGSPSLILKYSCIHSNLSFSMYFFSFLKIHPCLYSCWMRFSHSYDRQTCQTSPWTVLNISWSWRKWPSSTLKAWIIVLVSTLWQRSWRSVWRSWRSRWLAFPRRYIWKTIWRKETFHH